MPILNFLNSFDQIALKLLQGKSRRCIMLDTIVHVNGFLKAPGFFLMEKAGLVSPDYGWENIKIRYCKHFEVGLEVHGKAPLYTSIDSIEQRALQAIKLCRAHFSDIVIEPDLLVIEGSVSHSKEIHTGYRINFTEERDYSKPVMMDITWDRRKKSFRILVNVFDHFIDGVPALFLVNAVHHHLMMGKHSRLLSLTRTPATNYQKTADRFPLQPEKSRWVRLLYRQDNTLWPAGAPVDVTNSAITALRDRISRERGIRLSVSSLELALLAMETGMEYTTDYIARGETSDSGALDLTKGYRGLGMIQAKGYTDLQKMDSDDQYRELCTHLEGISDQLPLEKKGKGRSSVFYRRYGRARKFIVDFFEKRVTFKKVMTIAGTQCIGSNLNGVDTLFDVLTPGLTGEDVRYIFTASHGEFAPHIHKARQHRGLPLYATEISLACGPLTTDSEGGRNIYKSIKTSPEKAREILRRWSIHTADLDEDSLLVKLFNELYRPSAPLKGRIEKRAAVLLEAGRTSLT